MTDTTKDDTGNIIEFIPRDKYEKEYALAPEEDPNYVDPNRADPTINPVPSYDPEDSFTTQFERLANQGDLKRLALPRELNRRQVVNSFMDAFHLIGGVPRLAYWADSHPTEFYKLYARLLPSQATKDVAETNERRIIHAIPPTELDG